MGFYANAEDIVYSSTWVPTALASPGQPYTRTTAILCTAAGTLVCDLLGNVGQPGAISIGIPFAVNQIVELAALRVHTGSTGTFIALY